MHAGPIPRIGLLYNHAENGMTDEKKPFSVPEYRRMAEVLQTMSNNIRLRPAMDHHFAERLEKLSKEMVEDCHRAHDPDSD